MPYLQPATNNYFGFQPASGAGMVNINLYLVSSSEANQISPGDVVVYATHTSASSVRRLTGSTSTDAGIPVGVSASLVIAGAGSTGASLRSLTSQNVLVYDNPETLFVGCDTTSGVIGGGVAVGKSVWVCATGVTGSTGLASYNRSVMALSAVTASSQAIFRVIGLHPVEAGYSTVAAGTAAAATEVRKWILQPDIHVNAGYGVATGHVTT